MMKNKIRKDISVLKKKMTAEQRQCWSEQLSLCIEQHPVFMQTQTVMAYYPMKDEADLRILLDKYVNDKKLLLPVVEGDDIRLKVYKGPAFMRTGAYGILEPDTDEYFTDLASIDLVLVPGVAFTREGARLGRGKGYYDRFLPLVPQARKIGVGYAFQLIDEIPMSPEDVYLDDIICCPPQEC